MVPKFVPVVGIALALGATGIAQSRGRINLEAADCSRINQMFGDYEVGRSTQHATVPLAAGTLEQSAASRSTRRD